MTTPTVFFDEAGNTGAALTDPAQPVFVLASTDLSDEAADQFVAPLRTQQAREAKFSVLRKTEDGRRRLIELIASERLDPSHVKSMVTQKRFMVVTKLVDIIEETLAHEAGIDLYEHGANLALSNLHYYVSPVSCGEARFDEFLASFVEMIRRPSPDTKGRFFGAARSMYDGCTYEDHRASFAPYIYAEKCIDEILEGVTFLALDPAIPSFFTLCTAWGALFGSRFNTIHDSSKPMAAQKSIFEAMMDPTRETATIGYDRRKFDFPLKATGIVLADSVQHPALQLADLVAGATAYWASALARGERDALSDGLDAAGIRRFAIGALWPSLYVTPEALGTEEKGGISAVEYMTNALADRRI